MTRGSSVSGGAPIAPKRPDRRSMRWRMWSSGSGSRPCCIAIASSSRSELQRQERPGAVDGRSPAPLPAEAVGAILWSVRTRGLVIVLTCAAALLAGALWAGSQWSAPTPRRVGAPPPDLGARTVEFAGRSGRRLRGWFAPGAGTGSVVLVHGVRETRRSMLDRARFLHRAGYSVLLFDLSAHGESDGDRVGFGLTEADDVRAAVEFVRAARPGEPVAAIGFSLGGAACVLGAPPLPVDALVLEAVYPDIETAVGNRLRVRLGRLGPLLTPLLTWQLEARWGIDRRDLRPVDAIRRVRVPLLLVAGADDPRTTPADAARLFAAAAEPKQLWIVPAAAHEDFHRITPAEYELRVLDFLNHAFVADGH